MCQLIADVFYRVRTDVKDSLFLGNETTSIVANTEVEINPVIFTVSDLGYSGPLVASVLRVFGSYQVQL